MGNKKNLNDKNKQNEDSDSDFEEFSKQFSENDFPEDFSDKMRELFLKEMYEQNSNKKSKKTNDSIKNQTENLDNNNQIPEYVYEDTTQDEEAAYEVEEPSDTVDETGFLSEEPQEYKSSYKDFERTTFMDRDLTRDETTLKNLINRILKTVQLNESVINLYETLDSLTSFLNTIKLRNIYKRKELEFFVSCFIYTLLVRNINFNMSFIAYIDKLIDKKIISYNDLLFVQDSYLSMNHPNFEKRKKKEQISSLTRRIANQICKDVFNKLNFDFESRPTNYTTVSTETGKKYSELGMSYVRQTIEPRKGISITFGGIEPNPVPLYDALANVLPKEPRDINWGECKDILQKYISDLKEKLKIAKNDKMKQVIQYAIDNLHKAPYILKEKPKMTEFPDVNLVRERSHQYLENIYNSFKEDCSKIVTQELNKLLGPSESRLENILTTRKNAELIRLERERENERRRELLKLSSAEKFEKKRLGKEEYNKLYGNLSKEELKKKLLEVKLPEVEEQIKMKDTPSYIKERKKRQLRQLISKTSIEGNLFTARRKREEQPVKKRKSRKLSDDEEDREEEYSESSEIDELESEPEVFDLVDEETQKLSKEIMQEMKIQEELEEKELKELRQDIERREVQSKLSKIGISNTQTSKETPSLLQTTGSHVITLSSYSDTTKTSETYYDDTSSETSDTSDTSSETSDTSSETSDTDTKMEMD